MRLKVTLLTVLVFIATLLGINTVEASSIPIQAACPQGQQLCPPDYTCVVMGANPGACTNNGKVVEGWIGGCQNEMGGKQKWAVIGATFLHGNADFIFHSPIYGKHRAAGDFDGDGATYEWSNGKSERAGRVSFSIIRDTHTPQTRIKRAWVKCECPCKQKMSQIDTDTHRNLLLARYYVRLARQYTWRAVLDNPGNRRIQYWGNIALHHELLAKNALFQANKAP